MSERTEPFLKEGFHQRKSKGSLSMYSRIRTGKTSNKGNKRVYKEHTVLNPTSQESFDFQSEKRSGLSDPYTIKERFLHLVEGWIILTHI